MRMFLKKISKKIQTLKCIDTCTCAQLFNLLRNINVKTGLKENNLVVKALDSQFRDSGFKPLDGSKVDSNLVLPGAIK